MSRLLPQPPVLVITDRRQAYLPLLEQAGELLAGGCRWLSLREKDLPAAERAALLRALLALGKDYGATIAVHEDLAAAAASGGAAVHLPAGGSVAEAKRILGSGALIGRSAHSAAEVDAAAAAGADYVTLSPIFASASKPGYGPALGPAALDRAAPLPVLALGGIEPGNAAACVAAGAAGIAVMGEAMRTPHPREFMAGLLQALGSALAGRGGG